MKNTRELRKRMGLSQERFAHLLGVTVTTVGRWENKKYVPIPLFQRLLDCIEEAVNEKGTCTRNHIEGQDRHSSECYQGLYEETLRNIARSVVAGAESHHKPPGTEDLVEQGIKEGKAAREAVEAQSISPTAPCQTCTHEFSDHDQMGCRACECDAFCEMIDCC